LDLFKKWYLFHVKKQLVLNDYPSLWGVEEINSVDGIFTDYIKRDARVIELGAGWKDNLKVLKQNGFVGSYESFDIDESIEHDYRSLGEIKRKN
jgi:hypothetical protein